MAPRVKRPKVLIEPHYHPSGRPVRYNIYKRLPIWRTPQEGPMTPRLKLPAVRDAIGFAYVRPEPIFDED